MAISNITTQKYTLGRGRVYFSRFRDDTQLPSGFRYIGNSPEFNLTIESENLDHFSSDYGINEKDDSVPLSVTRTGSMSTDNIDMENIALFFFGDKSDVTIVGATGGSEVFESVIGGTTVKLGVTDTAPAGIFGIDPDDFNVSLDGASLVAATQTITFTSTGPSDGDTVSIGDVVYTFKNTPVAPYDVDINSTPTTQAGNLVAAINAGAGAGTTYGTGTVVHPDVSANNSSGVVTVTAKVEGTAGNAIAVAEDADNTAVGGALLAGGTGTSYIEGVDYEVDYDAGIVAFIDGGAITDGLDIQIDYATKSHTRERVISGTEPVEGAMMYIENNPKGANKNWMFAWVKITPNGDYALKGDDWQTIPFSVEVLKKTTAAAITVDGTPAYS